MQGKGDISFLGGKRMVWRVEVSLTLQFVNRFRSVTIVPISICSDIGLFEHRPSLVCSGWCFLLVCVRVCACAHFFSLTCGLPLSFFLCPLDRVAAEGARRKEKHRAESILGVDSAHEHGVDWNWGEGKRTGQPVPRVCPEEKRID